tara:strand:- start:131 stop:361 length:231 start_codon:yes stop_codon:yes gene_type:complete
MDMVRFNIYERLRDFKVPSTVLDNIFLEQTDAQILIDAFSSLIDDGYTEDEAAKKISKMIFKELDISPDQSIEEEK